MNRNDCRVDATRLIAFAIGAALCSTAPHGAWALPHGEQVVAGSVVVNRPASGRLLIQQGAAPAIVNWQGFSIDAGESVAIQQPQTTSVLLNRVVGGDPSRIFGRLSANGNVFLINPSGVLFGAGSSVDVGSLVVSTLGLADADFLAGRYRFSGDGGSVVNRGTLSASARGTVALLGGSVSNDGSIHARLGTAALAAGSKVTLDLAGDGLSKIVVTEAALDAQVANGGAIVADGGAISLSAPALDSLMSTAVNQSGVLRARSLVERNGRIVLDSGSGGTTLVAGSIDATGLATGLRGGGIVALGGHVGATATALLDASGSAGGGTVRLGSDPEAPEQGRVTAAFVGPQATLRADAVDRGDGGSIVVRGTDTARIHGTLSARGGALGGDGGRIETSGGFLDTAGARIDAASPAGRPGRWLLDPADIAIVSSGTGTTANAGSAPDFTATASSATVTDAAISTALNGGTSVVVQTGAAGPEVGDLTMQGAASIEYTGAAPVSLTFTASRNITINGIARIVASGPGSLSLDLNAALSGRGAIGIGNATIVTNGGSVRMYGQNDPVNGFAAGGAGQPGVTLTDSTIDVGSGSVAIRGLGGTGTPSATVPASPGAAGVSVRGGSRVTTTSGSLTLIGVGGPGVASPNGAGGAGTAGGSGVEVNTRALLGTASGALSLTGTGGLGGAGGVGGNGGPGSDGRNGGTGGGGGTGGDGVKLGDLGGTSGTSTPIIAQTASITGTGGAGGPGGSGGNGGNGDGGIGGNGGTGGPSAAGGSGVKMTGPLTVTTAALLSVTGLGGAAGTPGQGGDGGTGTTGGDAGTSTPFAGAADGVTLATGAGLRATGGVITLLGTSGTGAAAGAPGAAGTGGSGPGRPANGIPAQLGGYGLRIEDSTLDAFDVHLTGIAQEIGAPSLAQRGRAGVRSSNMQLAASRGVDIRGVGSADSGVSMGAGDVVTSGSAPVDITGDTTSPTAPGLSVGPGTLGGSGQTADIVLRARNGGTADSIVLGTAGSAVASVTTAGTLVLAPGGLSTGASTVVPANAVPINVGTTSATGFELSPTDLSAIGPGTRAVVIGSDTHTGAIVAAPPGVLPFDLTLQNQGAGSAGIALPNGLSAAAHTVALATEGPLTSGGPIVANALQIRGGAATPIDFSDPRNAVNTLAVDPPASVTFVNSGPLRLGPVNAQSFASSAQAARTSVVTDSASLGDFSVQTLVGALTLDQNITASGAGANITLAAAATFDNAGAGALTPGAGGRWRVWADTWVGERRGGLAPTTPNPNFYGCVYGAAGCASNVTLPTAGNHFIYVQRPSASVASADQSRLYGAANPAPMLVVPATGLVNGDITNDAFSGTLSQTATATSPVGSYPVVATSVQSPVGYSLTFVPGRLAITPAPLTITADSKTRLEGTLNPALTASFNGFVLGDAPALALQAGLTLTTPGGAGAPAGIYPIVASPIALANYTVTQVPGTLQVVPNPVSRLYTEYPWAHQVYGPSRDVLPMCTTSGSPILDAVTEGIDTLSLEWSRVRYQPNLRQCVDIAHRNGCSDF